MAHLFRRFRCKAHQRYGAICRPRTACEGCWWVWFYYKLATFGLLTPKFPDDIPASVMDTHNLHRHESTRRRR